MCVRPVSWHFGCSIYRLIPLALYRQSLNGSHLLDDRHSSVWQAFLKSRQSPALSSALSCQWTLSGPPRQGAGLREARSGPCSHAVMCSVSVRPRANSLTATYTSGIALRRQSFSASARGQERIYKDIYYNCTSNWTSRDLSSTNRCERREALLSPMAPAALFLR